MSNAKEVQLFHIGPVTEAPSPSSFVLKLMTYFRMTKIDYKVVETTRSSSKGKIPFIKYNGKEIADSTFIIELLNKEFDVDLNSSLSEIDKAVSIAFQRLCEENLYWSMVYHRWYDCKDKFFGKFVMSSVMKAGMKVAAAIKYKPAIKANLNGHGMGRHNEAEIYRIAEKDITSLSTFLGEKQYLMGDEPTEVDAVVFGLMAQFVYVQVGTKEEDLIREKFPNIITYCNRIKSKYWPDWDEHCAHQK